jgi:hypothetical protein
MLSSLWRDLKVQEKYKTHVSDIQPMKPNSLRLYSTVATIKWLINKYKFYTHNNLEELVLEYDSHHLLKFGCLLKII